MLALDLIDRRTMWRDYWIEWMVATVLIAIDEWLHWRVAVLSGRKTSVQIDASAATHFDLRLSR